MKLLDDIHIDIIHQDIRMKYKIKDMKIFYIGIYKDILDIIKLCMCSEKYKLL
jgi:hypothetical protein